MRSKFACLLISFVLAWPLAAQVPTSLRLDLPRLTNDWLRLRSSLRPDALMQLQATTNFLDWTTVGTTHDRFWNFPTPVTKPGLFYRLRAQSLSPLDDWKNEALFPEEKLRSAEGQELRWVKFAILLNDPTRVYFQDSAKYPFHYEFATQRLPGFGGMGRAAFDAISLRRANQQVVLGTILYPPTNDYNEYGVQFVGLDPYTPEEISRWFELVKASVFATNGAGVYYMPVFEQAEMARTSAAEFAARNIPVASVERWISQDHIYSPGWAVGRLKYFPAVEITAAFSDGRLQPQDILLTDGVPAETPVVAGIISLTPSTPNSHTAILAQSFGIPFVYFPDSVEQARVQALVNRKIVLRATTTWSGASIKVVDVEGSLGAEVEAELLGLKKSAPIKYAPKQSFGAITASTENLGPADIKYFGGKAANYGILRDTVPTNCPPAIALSFDLWDQFMDQQLPTGLTLRQRIGEILAPYTNYPPNIPALKNDLATIRDLIRRDAAFTSAQKQAITNALTIFNPMRNIRFRSSTNVEDSEGFTGAGLYDSFSGCLADDIDGDTAGPCLCDSSENNERGVFRAIQRVYASFYNDNAFLERLRHGVKESEVGMGVLVHHSFPDEEELANGVATLQFYVGFSTNVNGDLVTQLGAESVTNPTGGSTPEVVKLDRFADFNELTLLRRSSLVPLGATVMSWQDDYVGFAKLFGRVGSGYSKLASKESFKLDFEYKKDVNLGLVVKQVREIPRIVNDKVVPAFLVNEPTTWCVFQGEQGDIFSNHRLKSIWTLDTATFKLDPTNLTQGLYRSGSVQYVSNGVTRMLSGPLSSWPASSTSADGITNFWTTGSGSDRLEWRIETYFPTMVTGTEAPVFTQQDFPITVWIIYGRALPALDYDGKPILRIDDTVTLRPRPEHKPGDILREYNFTAKNGAQIATSFYWPKPPTGVVAGYTAPLVEFVQTKITGLTPSPITLSNYYSQTYHPFHHNFTEEFIFEPRLDPNVSAADIAALEAVNVRLIYVRRGEEGTVIKALSPGETFRDL